MTTTEAPAFALGQRVIWQEWDELGRAFQPAAPLSRKVWRSARDGLSVESGTTAHERSPRPRTGVVVGLRTLSNGTLHYLDYDRWPAFRATEAFPAVLLSWGLRRKPVLVRPEHVRPESTEVSR